MKKRILAIVMAAAMCLGLTACGGSDSTSVSAGTSSADQSAPAQLSDDGNASSAAGADASKEEKIKIGMIWYGNTDAMGGTFYSWANHAAEILNVELIWKLGSYTTADELTDCENLISAGCQGIYFIPMDTSANLQLGTACQNAGVYWSISNRQISDEEILAACEANPYFVNRIYDNSYDVCKEMVKVLADQGIKKVCVLTGDPNDGMMVERNQGFADGCEEYGVEVLAESRLVSGDASANVNSVNNFLTLYSDMEGILAASGTAGVGEGIITALNASGREPGSVKVAAFDTFDGNQEVYNAFYLPVNTLFFVAYAGENEVFEGVFLICSHFQYQNSIIYHPSATRSVALVQVSLKRFAPVPCIPLFLVISSYRKGRS